MKHATAKKSIPLVELLQKRENTMDWICVFLFALCPIIQNYRGLFVDARATVLALCVPYILYKFWMKNKINWVLVTPLICFGVCKILQGGISFVDFGREGLVCLYLLAAASGVIDPRKFFYAILSVACLASVLIIFQYICYYIFGFHLQLVPTSLLLDNAEQWVKMAQTGRYSIKGKLMSFYRPSSFFLEPAHMALYCTPSLVFLLLSPKMDRVRLIFAVLLSAGIMASTSGLGIMLCLGLWFLYFAFYCGENGSPEEIRIWKLKIKPLHIKGFTLKSRSFKRFKTKSFTFKGFTLRPINILLIGSLFVLVILLYLTVDVFRSSINRIFFSADGYNAISGRTRVGAHVVSEMGGLDLLIGKQVKGSEADWYMSAFFATIYDYGLIGLVFSYIFYFVSLFTLKRQYFWIALMIIGLSFFSVHTHGSAYMLFFCTILFGGHFYSGIDRRIGLSLRIHPLGWISRKKKEESGDQDIVKGDQHE